MFFDPADFPDTWPDVDMVIREAESKAFLAAPVLATLTRDDPVVPPDVDTWWAQTRAVLYRVVAEWYGQGYEGLKTQMVAQWQKGWWRAAGDLSPQTVAELRAVAAKAAGPGPSLVPCWSAPPAGSLQGLFATPHDRPPWRP